jgi:hypothetical protein
MSAAPLRLHWRLAACVAACALLPLTCAAADGDNDLFDLSLDQLRNV